MTGVFFLSLFLSHSDCLFPSNIPVNPLCELMAPYIGAAALILFCGLDGSYIYKPSAAIQTRRHFPSLLHHPPSAALYLSILLSVNMKGFQIKGNVKTLKLSPPSFLFGVYLDIMVELTWSLICQILITQKDGSSCANGNGHNEKEKQNKEDIYVGEEEAKVHGYVCKTIHLCVVCAAQLYIQFRATTLSGRAYNDQSESTRVTQKVRLCRVCRATAPHKSIYTGKCRLFEEGSQSIVL